MKSTAIFGRFSRAYYLFGGMVLATLALCLVMVFADAKPAQAVEESWYGTVDWTEKGTYTNEYGAVVTQNSRVYYEAPVSAAKASIYLKTYVRWTYPKPSGGGCYLASKTERGSGYDTDAEIRVTETRTSDGKPFLSIWSHDYYTGVPYVGSTTYEYAGIRSDGTSCPPPETRPWPSNRMYKSERFDATKTVGTTSRLCDFNSESSYVMPCTADQNLDFNTEGIPTTVRWSLTKDECSGYSNFWNIGNDDRLVLFDPCQTQSLNSRMSVFDDIPGTPEVCSYSFSLPDDTVGTKLASRLNRLCDGYKAVLRTQWSQVRWFAYNAARWNACAVWVVDDASWRPPKITSATRDSDGQPIAWISPGRTEYVRTATGWEPVKCPG